MEKLSRNVKMNIELNVTVAANEADKDDDLDLRGLFAEMVGVSRRTIDRAAFLLKVAPKDMMAKVEAGEMEIGEAFQTVTDVNFGVKKSAADGEAQAAVPEQDVGMILTAIGDFIEAIRRELDKKRPDVKEMCGMISDARRLVDKGLAIYLA